MQTQSGLTFEATEDGRIKLTNRSWDNKEPILIPEDELRWMLRMIEKSKP